MSMAARAHAFLSLVSADTLARAAHRQRAIELLLRAYDGPIFHLDSNVQGSPVDEIGSPRSGNESLGPIDGSFFGQFGRRGSGRARGNPPPSGGAD